VKTLLAFASLAIGLCLCTVALCVFGAALGSAPGLSESEEHQHSPPSACAVADTTAPVAESTLVSPSATSTELLTATVAASPTLLSGAPIACTHAVVASVVDGDTIVLDSGETVRYIGVDTPETDECYGREATEINRQLVEGKAVILIGDVEERDRYGRLLFYVIADGRFVNAELVRLGYARAESYGDSVMFQQVLTVFERYAYESGAGLWGACEHE